MLSSTWLDFGSARASSTSGGRRDRAAAVRSEHSDLLTRSERTSNWQQDPYFRLEGMSAEGPLTRESRARSRKPSPRDRRLPHRGEPAGRSASFSQRCRLFDAARGESHDARPPLTALVITARTVSKMPIRSLLPKRSPTTSTNATRPRSSMPSARSLSCGPIRLPRRSGIGIPSVSTASSSAAHDRSAEACDVRPQARSATAGTSRSRDSRLASMSPRTYPMSHSACSRGGSARSSASYSRRNDERRDRGTPFHQPEHGEGARAPHSRETRSSKLASKR